MNTDLLLSLLEEIAHLKAEIIQLHKKAAIIDGPFCEDTFSKDRLLAFEALIEEFSEHI